VYTRLLRAILDDGAGVTQFWVGHDVGNAPSERGIARAGLGLVSAVYYVRDGGLGMVAYAAPHQSAPDARAVEASRLFKIPLVGTLPAPAP
jgi:hypothetical protein